MAFELLLFNFSKRQNSTAIPPDATGVAVEVTLKNETSFNNPVFLLSGVAASYNYAKFRGFYYFIDDVRSVRNGLYELVCRVDVLGTYRTQIGNTSAFVEYAQQGNSQIVDPRIGVEFGVAGFNSANASVFPGSLILASGSIYITVTGQFGTDTYYIPESSLRNLFNSISNWTDGVIDTTSLDSILETGLKQLIGCGNAANNIRSAYILPCGVIPEVLGNATNIYLGMFNTGVDAYPVEGMGLATKIESISIPHQYAAGDWRRQVPYEVCQLFLPLYGVVPIPSDMAADSSALTIECRLNVKSGDFTYYVSGGSRNGKEIVVGGNCSAPVAAGVSNINMSTAMNAGLQLGANMAFGNAMGVAASLLSISPMPCGSGQAGGSSNTYPNAVCMIYYRNTSEAPGTSAATQGIPLQATRQLSSLSGYVKTKGASVSGVIWGALRDRINDMLDAGFYRE